MTKQSWNAFEDSSIHLPVDAFGQGLQLHKFPSAVNQFLGLRASEVGVCLLYCHDIPYDLERNLQVYCFVFVSWFLWFFLYFK